MVVIIAYMHLGFFGVALIAALVFNGVFRDFAAACAVTRALSDGGPRTAGCVPRPCVGGAGQEAALEPAFHLSIHLCVRRAPSHSSGLRESL